MYSIPIFKSHYSFERSILTLKDKESNDDESPDSIFPMLEEVGMKNLYLVEDHFSGFIETNLNCQKRGVQLNYGLRFTVCNDMTDKTTESKASNCKVYLIGKNNDGYNNLIKVYSAASTDGLHGVPRIDWDFLDKVVDNKSLQLVIPFYDSYLFNNTMYDNVCCPNIIDHAIYLEEDNDLPFDDIISKKLHERDRQIVQAQSIYYNKRSDFLVYLSRKCIGGRKTLSAPNFDHMCSDNFCWEAWKEKNGHD